MRWSVPRIWENGECWIIGGGPSVPRQFGIPESVIQKVLSRELDPSAYSSYLAPIHNKHIIGINSAFLIGDWIDMVFFGDKRWYLENREQLAAFPGLKVSCHASLLRNNKEKIKVLLRNGKHGQGISPDYSKICWNGNSGSAAISVAVNTGATKIILLGFDMKLDKDSKQHWHGLYGTAFRKAAEVKGLPFDRHKRGFSAIQRDALIRGVEIINACPDSSITQFRKVTVKEILNGEDK